MSPKQISCLKALKDKIHKEILFGGAAGGGKSWIGCVWLVTSCLQYPGSRWLLGRAVLKNLKESTLLTFFEVCKRFGLKAGSDFVYNGQANYIKFVNGSEVYLKDLFLYPSDPEFDSLGSTEYTGAFIDEASQITVKAKNILSSRLRYKLEEFDLIPKLLIATNPAKNFLYTQFYKPSVNGTIKEYRLFIPSLVQDNPYISPHYIENLKALDETSKQRLLFGNWEYDDDPAKMMDYDAITDIFTNTFVEGGDRYLTADLAMMGRDLFIVIVWEGLRGKIVLVKKKASGKEIEEDLRRLSKNHKIPRSKIVVDSDGLGNYLGSYMEGIQEFKGGGKAWETDKFANSRSECYFKLAEIVNKRLIYLECDNPSWKDQIIEELEQIKRDKVDNDEQKLRVVKKEDIRENIGRSTDWADVLMMRMYALIHDLDFKVMDAKGIGFF